MPWSPVYDLVTKNPRTDFELALYHTFYFMSFQGIRARLGRELAPIATHVLIVLLIETSLVAIGLATKGFRYMLPERKDNIALIEKLDTVTALILLALFASYTIGLVAIRLWSALAEEIRRDKNSSGGT